MRLPSITPKQLIRVLQKCGFSIHHQRGSHYYLRHPERPGIQVCVPYHTADLKRGLLHGILKDAGVSMDDLLEKL